LKRNKRIRKLVKPEQLKKKLIVNLSSNSSKPQLKQKNIKIVKVDQMMNAVKKVMK